MLVKWCQVGAIPIKNFMTVSLSSGDVWSTISSCGSVTGIHFRLASSLGQYEQVSSSSGEKSSSSVRKELKGYCDMFENPVTRSVALRKCAAEKTHRGYSTEHGVVSEKREVRPVYVEHFSFGESGKMWY